MKWELKKRLGCLHSHYSNIDYIEKALSSFDIELIHFVDPALIYRVTTDQNFRGSDAQNKMKEQLDWIAKCHVDAILITCTNYIVLLEEAQIISIPIIKIDEPYFDYICNIQQPQIILFTNPATVKGTIARLNHYANTHQKSLDYEVIVIKDTFELIMQGRKEEYNLEVSMFLKKIIAENKMKVISVAQLSMVDAAQQVEYKTSKTIVNPLNTLISSLVNQLEIENKNPNKK